MTAPAAHAAPETGAIAQSVKSALTDAAVFASPYRHWIRQGLLPEATIDELLNIDAPAPDLGGVSGKRELHNDQRAYFDQPRIAENTSVAAVAAAYQSSDLARFIADFFSVELDDTFLRIEYAVDTTGFWLQPHTDLGVKRLTILHYISDDPDQHDCGTDIYNADKSWAKRTPFSRNTALAFVPGDATYHGYEKRPIAGVRKSLIINYVTEDWRDREQLAFPDRRVAVS